MALNSVTSCSVRPTEAAASSPHRSSQLDSPEPICEVSCRYRNTAQWRNLEHIEVVSHHSFTMSFKSCVACPLNTQSFALQRKVNKRFRISLIILPSSVPGAKERLYVEKENPGVLRAIQSPNSILE